MLRKYRQNRQFCQFQRELTPRKLTDRPCVRMDLSVDLSAKITLKLTELTELTEIFSLLLNR